MNEPFGHQGLELRTRRRSSPLLRRTPSSSSTTSTLANFGRPSTFAICVGLDRLRDAPPRRGYDGDACRGQDAACGGVEDVEMDSGHGDANSGLKSSVLMSSLTGYQEGHCSLLDQCHRLEENVGLDSDDISLCMQSWTLSFLVPRCWKRSVETRTFSTITGESDT